MSITPFSSASGGFTNVTNFPDIPPNSAAMRAQMQIPSDELGNYINSTLIPEIAPISIFTGTIHAFGGATAPTGSLLCDGTAVSRSTYSALFAAIGTAWGVGDGSTTFNLPNLKGQTLVGLDASQTEFNALGKTGGEKTHTLTTPEMPAHTHQIGAYGYTYNATGTGYIVTGGNGAPVSGSTGGGGAHNNLQPYAVVNYIIVY